ncbi:MDR family MFS transporter [Alicyclobacillus macrosporangiidus]|uniref:MDR family MFS transporter n=1 Tax=Alicyclobacillus macrosporangiidus TaxID=392015 RepID=UPI0009DDB167|nr:MDR family MFS transporter [Alicyclobacillus macrosporangiidus]
MNRPNHPEGANLANSGADAFRPDASSASAEADEAGHASIKHRGILITGLIIAMLFGALDQTIVGTAMPRIVGELGGLAYMAWLTTAYMLTSTTVVPIAGKLADLLGRRVVYVTGLAIFMIGSALCGAAHTMNQLIFFRGFQGIGGGIMMPMAMVIIGDLFTGAERAKWQGVFGAIFGLSSIVGPQIGGWIVDALSWRWVFYINLPIALVAIVFISMGLHSHRRSERVTFDIPGIVTMVVGVVSLLLALTFGGKDYPWTSWQILGLFAIALVSLTAFVLIEARAAEPILPLRLFRNRTFVLINGIGFLMSVGMFGSIMFIPLFLQGIIGISPSASGTAMTPMMLTVMAGSMVGGRLVTKIGVRTQTTIGMLIMAASFILLANLTVHTKTLAVTGCMIILGIGMGLVMPLLTIALQESFPRTELGVVTSSSQFFRQIGGTFGMTILGAMLNARSSALLTAQLDPLLQRIPANPMVAQLKSMIATNAQGLYSSLLNPNALVQMPAVFKDTLVPVLKSALVESLHSVFWFGLVFILLGVVCSLFLGKIRISSRRGARPAPSEA